MALLVERKTRFLILLQLPHGRSALDVEEAMLAATKRLPQVLWKSLTWDRGSEMARHAEIKLATGLDIYFCDPAKPWQRGSNENTNGLLRQYFPKGGDDVWLNNNTPGETFYMSYQATGGGWAHWGNMTTGANAPYWVEQWNAYEWTNGGPNGP